ncbi:MAG TPA: M56 family metallopeptidase [Sphingomicrobium sp.]|nr:M56 family metallopeptidase [Sphingomicrobium sp.]
MDLLLPIAAKSFLVAGAVLLLLKLAQKRSASDRSWIAHLGLVAILLLPAAALALPALNVEGPSFLASRSVEAAVAAESLAAAPADTALKSETASTAGTFPDASEAIAPAPVDWAVWAYAAPAVLLLLLTLIALGRLFALKGRASVMVEPNWLTALARAQRRMGFKHGTALLTSDELPSPISWGVIRPVILLNSEAAESHHEAEAIIAHELAHVANLDWAKLLLSRVAVAMFWFNPLVWVLAREAHQLREEAADDAVLGADIEDTEYARLLVGVARHECRGLLIGAHGVAPGKNSLARRVRRVLDGALERAPGGWRWSTAAAFFAAGMAVPVAALNVVPTTPASASASASQSQVATNAPKPDHGRPYYEGPVEQPVSDAIAASSTAAALAADKSEWSQKLAHDIKNAIEGQWDQNGIHKSNNARAAALHSLGATPGYMASLRAASPQLADVPDEELLPLVALHVSPAYIRELAGAGLRNLDVDELTEARALGIRGDYIRSLASAGYRNLSVDQLGELRTMGVTAADIQRFRRAGHKRLSVDDLVELKAAGHVNVHSDHDRDPDPDPGVDVDNDPEDGS